MLERVAQSVGCQPTSDRILLPDDSALSAAAEGMLLAGLHDLGDSSCVEVQALVLISLST